jgi:hypothetical protein
VPHLTVNTPANYQKFSQLIPVQGVHTHNQNHPRFSPALQAKLAMVFLPIFISNTSDLIT